MASEKILVVDDETDLQFVINQIPQANTQQSVRIPFRLQRTGNDGKTY